MQTHVHQIIKLRKTRRIRTDVPTDRCVHPLNLTLTYETPINGSVQVGAASSVVVLVDKAENSRHHVGSPHPAALSANHLTEGFINLSQIGLNITLTNPKLDLTMIGRRTHCADSHLLIITTIYPVTSEGRWGTTDDFQPRLCISNSWTVRQAVRSGYVKPIL